MSRSEATQGSKFSLCLPRAGLDNVGDGAATAGFMARAVS